MDRWFTPQERGVILFLVAALLVGAAVYIYKSRNPYFAPELKILESGKWTELDESVAAGFSLRQEHETKDSLEQLIQETRAKLTRRTSQTGGEKLLADIKVGVGGSRRIPMESSGLLSKEGVPAKINVNTATEQELITLPGIGPVLAKRIIEYRERSGGFKKLNDIIRVRGIGQKKFEKLKDKITI